MLVSSSSFGRVAGRRSPVAGRRSARDALAGLPPAGRGNDLQRRGSPARAVMTRSSRETFYHLQLYCQHDFCLSGDAFVAASRMKVAVGTSFVLILAVVSESIWLIWPNITSPERNRPSDLLVDGVYFLLFGAASALVQTPMAIADRSRAALGHIAIVATVSAEVGS